MLLSFCHSMDIFALLAIIYLTRYDNKDHYKCPVLFHRSSPGGTSGFSIYRTTHQAASRYQTQCAGLARWLAINSASLAEGGRLNVRRAKWSPYAFVGLLPTDKCIDMIAIGSPHNVLSLISLLPNIILQQLLTSDVWHCQIQIDFSYQMEKKSFKFDKHWLIKVSSLCWTT